MAATSSETDRKFVAFGRKNTGISQINGLDDLYQGWPSKAKTKDFNSMLRPRTCSRKAKAANFGLEVKAKD